MFTIVFKFMLGLYLCTSLVESAESAPNVTATTTTTTTTTELPLDLSGADTRRFESSVQLDPGETRSRSKSHSYSYRGDAYGNKGPTYERNEYENQGVEYDKDSRSHEDFYKDSGEDNYRQHHPQQQNHHSPPEDYPDSYEPAYEQHHHQQNQDNSYEKHNENRPKYSYPDHSNSAQSPYGHQDYSKESYESKEEERYRGGSAPYVPQYAYEVSQKKQQQATYDPLDVPDTHGKSGYGPGETKVYPSKELQKSEYYPRPKPTRYVPKSSHDEEHRNKEENYFPTIPKEAGYVSSGEKEPGYLQTLKEPSYSQQAGYFPRHQGPSSILQHLPKEGQAELSSGRKLAIYIKHLGHKDSQNVPKERHGFLLLPVVPEKVEQKLAELKEGNFGREYKQAYHNDKEPIHQQRQVQEHEVYSHQNVPQEKYGVQPKVAIPYDDDDCNHQDKESGEPRGKSVFSHASYGLFRPIIRHPSYLDSQYENHKITHVHPYSGGEVSEENHAPYLPTAVGHYKAEKEIKTYSGAPLEYGGPHGSLSGAAKFEPASVYKRAPEYISPYDITTSHKSSPIKISGFRPSIYSPLSHGVDYARLSDYSSPANKPKKNSGISQLYSTHYRNVGTRLATEYEHPKLDISSKKPKSIAIFLKKPKEEEQVVYRPSSYSLKEHISSKSLADIGLHEYDSLRTIPKSRGTDSGSVYYNLPHTYPVNHGFAPLNYRKAGTKYYS